MEKKKKKNSTKYSAVVRGGSIKILEENFCRYLFLQQLYNQIFSS